MLNTKLNCIFIIYQDKLYLNDRVKRLNFLKNLWLSNQALLIFYRNHFQHKTQKKIDQTIEV